MIQRYDFNLTDEPDENGFQPFMAAGILTGDADEALRPAIVICPGGGYYGVCEYWEGERFATCTREVYTQLNKNRLVQAFQSPHVLSPLHFQCSFLNAQFLYYLPMS